MCYSLKSSIKSWIVSFILCLIILCNQNISNSFTWIALFILTFTQIQIMESIIWGNLDKGKDVEQNSTNDNQFITYMILFMLLLQPIVNSGLAYKYSTSPNSSILLVMFMVFIGIIIYEFFTSLNDKFETTIGENGHLVWNRYKNTEINKYKKISFFGEAHKGKIISILYLLGLFVPFLFMDGAIKVIPLLFGSATFLYSYKNYKDEFSSMWCFTSMATSILTLLCYIFIGY